MLIGVPLETTVGETRVAVTPETAKKLTAQGHTVRVQAGAGVAASATDEAYQAAGAQIVERAAALGCELVLKVRSPFDDELAMMKPGTALVGMLNPFDAEGLKRLAEAGLTSFALEAAPRVELTPELAKRLAIDPALYNQAPFLQPMQQSALRLAQRYSQGCSGCQKAARARAFTAITNAMVSLLLQEQSKASTGLASFKQAVGSILKRPVDAVLLRYADASGQRKELRF